MPFWVLYWLVRSVLRAVAKTWSSEGEGCGFFWGGISWAATRSKMRTHFLRVAGVLGEDVSAERSSPPFLTSLSWQSMQCRSRKGWIAGGIAEASDAIEQSRKVVKRRALAVMPD